MIEFLELNGKRYRLNDLSSENRAVAHFMIEANKKIQELENLKAAFASARETYFAELKREIIQDKSGINLGDLFAD